LSIRINDKSVLPSVTGTTVSHGIKTYDSKALNDIFSSCKKSWRDTLCPRIFTIQAVLLLDATVFKFTMQHVAGDAVGKRLEPLTDQHRIADRPQLSTMRLPLSVKGFTTRFRNEQSKRIDNTKSPTMTAPHLEGGLYPHLFALNKRAIGGTSAQGTNSSQQ
jgi:hypothetical protein